MSGSSGQTVVHLLLLGSLVLVLVPAVPPPRDLPGAGGSSPSLGVVGSIIGSVACRVGWPSGRSGGRPGGPPVPLARRLADLLRAGAAWGRRHRVPTFVGGASMLLVGPVVLLAVVPLPVLAWWRSRRLAQREEQAIVDELPDVVDLLRLAVGAGCTVHLAVEAVARHAGGRTAGHLTTVLERTRRGARLGDALAILRSEVRPLAPVLDALISADRYGTPLVPVLARLADDARGDRRRRAEAAARRVPVQLLFPLVACILPAIGFLTVIPVASSALASLG